MIALYSPESEIELTLLKSLLESEHIRYFVHNDHFGSMYIGPQIQSFNRKTVLVTPDDAVKAKALLSVFLKNQQQHPDHSETVPPSTSGWDKFRLTIETLLFAWIVPRRKRSVKRSPEAPPTSDKK